MPEENGARLADEIEANYRRLQKLEGPFPKPAAPVVITVSNQKGGVGKTTTTVNLAAALADGGLNVVVIDADPQGNASTALGIDRKADIPSTYDVLVGEHTLAEALQTVSDSGLLRLCPATIDLAGAEVELAAISGRETRLNDAVEDFFEAGTDVDVMLIDCPPSLGLLTINSLVAADEVLVPVQAEYYALEGLSLLAETVDLVSNSLNPGLHISSMLLTMVDGRTKLSAEVAEEVRRHFPEQTFVTEIPRSVRISEAPSYGQTVLEYDPRGTGTVAYRSAALELARRMEAE